MSHNRSWKVGVVKACNDWLLEWTKSQIAPMWCSLVESKIQPRLIVQGRLTSRNFQSSWPIKKTTDMAPNFPFRYVIMRSAAPFNPMNRGFNVMILNNGEFNGWRDKTALRIDCGRRLKWVFHASRVRAMRSFSCLGELSLSPFLSSPILRNRNTSPRTVYYRSWRKLLKTTSLYLPAQH